MEINQAAISGNLTRDAEVRASQSGTAIVTFTVAVNERRKGANGDWQDVPSYIGCVWYGAYAEKAASSLKKGAKVFVGGKLHQSTWESNGERKSKLEIIVSDCVAQKRGEQQQQQHEPIQLYASDIPF